MNINLSALDTQHFGTRIARCRADGFLNAKEIDHWCIENDINMVIVRCGSDELSTINDLLEKNFIQFDVLVWYKKKLMELPVTSSFIRQATKDDTVAIENIARAAFTNYNGHYHEDKRLDAIKSTEAYVNWALSDSENIEKMVYDDGTIRGFVLVDTLMSTVPLYAVDNSSQGRGIGKILIGSALNICKQKGKETFSISTQENNLKSIGVWKRLGFEYSHAFCTFHKWYK